MMLLFTYMHMHELGTSGHGTRQAHDLIILLTCVGNNDEQTLHQARAYFKPT